MSAGELQWLSNHLGHDVATHKNNYRLHAPTIEITKVGKLLMEIDSGKVVDAGNVSNNSGGGRSSRKRDRSRMQYYVAHIYLQHACFSSFTLT